ncbi:RecQ family ATP-dependent DNA helicase [Fulvivirga lutea]|uniref:ATP-dependent DNA helicase RecQ n=1 Tax=Fulvivirga lutea TaxID=2810512 RepID=A0A974WE72_9BACT|nr:ATP-dependent DNA helicase RecQ [Fulvivirga lutea]QSE96120.1 RecQ family ATP-dependent DNA helicase [Fulvivirga lutea]
MSEIHSILKKYWGYDTFRPLQEDIIQAALDGNDVLALLPTGGGKSICFQVPALVKEGICIVVTPLIALMQDQVDQLKKRGIKAIAINSSLSKREIDLNLDNCIYGDVKFLYVSPERLSTDLFIERAQKMNINLLAIDEAHCISQWGYDFRPSYLQIAEFRKLLPEVSILALTATATPEVRADIAEKLEFKNKGNVFEKSFARANLSYSVRVVDDKERKLISALKSVKGSAIVYVNTRKAAKETATLLYKNGISADFYHAGLRHDERALKQKNWVQNKARVMVATNAFGMGIDKPDVRFVIHMNLPMDLESYYQEAGRAGRDEKKAFALIILNKADVLEIKERVRLQHPDVDLLKRVYQSLANYYKLAVGSGGDINYNFDLHQFSESYKLNHLEVYNALKKLEDEELLQFNEGFYAPSRLSFVVDNKALYEFQIANAKYDPLIKAILRIYGGELFSNYLKISELQIAKFLQTDEPTISSSLLKLNELGIVSYEKQKDSPQVVFVCQRYSVENLPINKSRLKQRSELAHSKMDAMINYALDDKRCRTAQLLDYFGEKNYDECGVCDICISKKKKDHDEEMHHYHHQIVSVMEDKSWAIDELVEQLNPKDKEEFLETVRQMVDTGELEYDEHWLLRKV